MNENNSDYKTFELEAHVLPNGKYGQQLAVDKITEYNEKGTSDDYLFHTNLKYTASTVMHLH